MSETQTFIVTKRQWFGSQMSGDNGTPYYEYGDGDNSMYGISPENLIGELLGDGSTIEISVRVLKRKPLKKNPWRRNP